MLRTESMDGMDMAMNDDGRRWLLGSPKRKEHGILELGE